MVYKNNPARATSQDLNGFIPISNFNKNYVVEVKSSLVFKHQATTSPTANENRAVKGLVLATATAKPTIKATYNSQRGLSFERVLYLDGTSQEVLK